MKLYYSPGACSLSPHIALREAGLNFELVQVDLASKKTASGQDYLEINPFGYVPCLQLDDGRMLAEGPAILQYVADQVPGKLLAPANGSWERVRLQEWLNFITSEIHKGFTPLFVPTSSDEMKAAAKQLEFERAAALRDEIQQIRLRVLDASAGEVCNAVESGEADFGVSFSGSLADEVEFEICTGRPKRLTGVEKGHVVFAAFEHR